MKIAITVCATSKYTYAMSAQARRIQAACLPFRNEEIIIIFATENEGIGEKYRSLYKSLLPKADFWLIKENFLDGQENYKQKAQLVIAQMRTAVMDVARRFEVDYCWSLDSDVLPSVNALKCSVQMLEFDDGYYSVSTCPYPSQGGGGWLGGRGTVYNPILQDWYDDERNVPDDLKKQKEELQKDMDAIQRTHKISLESGQGDHKKFMEDQERVGKAMQALMEKIRACPPKGNVFAMNASGWKRRGWLDQAYPAIGKGAVVPIDWCGFGCTLMNRQALSVAHFDGYDGKGTEDLYYVWHRLYQYGLRINAITHCPADHVIRNPGKAGYFIHMQGYHETEGECVGHLRIRPRAFFAFDAGEKFDEKNDGVLVPKKPDEPKPQEEVKKADDKPALNAEKMVEEILKEPKDPKKDKIDSK